MHWSLSAVAIHQGRTQQLWLVELRPIESLLHCDTVSLAYEVGDWHDALGAQSSLEPQTSSSSPAVTGTATEELIAIIHRLT